jgi:hypothetical protein
MKARNLHRFMITLQILISVMQGFSQVTYQQVETKTFQYLLEKKWDSIIFMSDKALKDNIDYSNLRLRRGIAWYEKQKYICAAWDLERAINFNNRDQVAKGYLYGAFLLSNQPDQARAITSGMTEVQKTDLGSTKNVLDNIRVEFGGALSNAFSRSDPSTLMGDDSIYGEQNLYGNSYYGHLEFSLNVSSRVQLTFGYSYLDFQKRILYQYAYPVDQLDSTVTVGNSYINYYSFPRNTKINSFNYPMNQNEFFIGATIIPSPGVSIMPAFRYIGVKYTLPTAVYKTWTVQDTSWYDETTGVYAIFPFNRASYGFSPVNVNLNNFLVGLKVTKQAGVFNAGLACSWSNLNGLDQYQTTWNLSYYPLGTLDFYGNTALIAMIEGNDARLIGTQMLGAKLSKWLWVEGDFLYGDISDGNLDNGMVVYNNPDKVDYRAGLSMIFPVFPTLQVALMYRFFQKESMITYYSPESNGTETVVVPLEKEMTYQTNNLFIGIKINL